MAALPQLEHFAYIFAQQNVSKIQHDCAERHKNA